MSLFSDTELFHSGSSRRVEYHLPDAELIYIEHFFGKEEADGYYTRLLHDTAWKEGKITLYGKEYVTPRLTAWYGDEGKRYAFSNHTLEPMPWTADLQQIRRRVEAEAHLTFNSVLLNLYRNGNDSVSWHRDNEKEFGENPVIGSVSFGATRPFQLRHKFRKDVEKLTVPLTHGSLLLMKGSTQHFWEHQIPKSSRPTQPRINLTFRLIRSVI